MAAMAASLLQPLRMLRRLAALILVLWFTGFGCFMGCEMNVSAAPAAKEEASETADSCPMASRDCCQKTEDNHLTSVETIPEQENSPSCCPLTGQAADPARKISNIDTPLAVTGGGLSFALNIHPVPKLSLQNLPVANKGSTHLLCCVFRI
jgi:hypothetical protein